MKNTGSLHALVGTTWVISLPLHKGVTITINWTGLDPQKRQKWGVSNVSACLTGLMVPSSPSKVTVIECTLTSVLEGSIVGLHHLDTGRDPQCGLEMSIC